MGVVDSQYVVHKGIQTLGGSDDHGATKVFASSPNIGLDPIISFVPLPTKNIDCISVLT